MSIILVLNPNIAVQRMAITGPFFGESILTGIRQFHIIVVNLGLLLKVSRRLLSTFRSDFILLCGLLSDKVLEVAEILVRVFRIG